MHPLELKVPPLAVGLILAAAMWLASHFLPALVLAIPWRAALALVLAGAGFALAAAGIVSFRRARTTFNPMKPESASTVVASGVYRFTRNPMYLGVFVALLGWAVFLDHLLAFALLAGFIPYMSRFQIVPEERALSALFGEEYVAYQRSGRRWL